MHAVLAGPHEYSAAHQTRGRKGTHQGGVLCICTCMCMCMCTCMSVCLYVCMYAWVPREQPISVYWSVVVIDFIIKRHHVDGCYCVFKWPFSSYALCAICDNRKAKNHPSALWVTKAEMQCTQREKEMWKINCHCANLMKLLKKTLLSLETLLNMFDLFDSQYDIDRA